MLKRFDSFYFERDNCYVFQTLALFPQWPLLFIELESLGKQAKKELLCFQFEFENWLQRALGSKHVENVSSLLPRTLSQSQPNLNEIVEHVLASWWWAVIKPLITCCPLDDFCWCHFDDVMYLDDKDWSFGYSFSSKFINGSKYPHEGPKMILFFLLPAHVQERYI